MCDHKNHVADVVRSHMIHSIPGTIYCCMSALEARTQP